VSFEKQFELEFVSGVDVITLCVYIRNAKRQGSLEDEVRLGVERAFMCNSNITDPFDEYSRKPDCLYRIVGLFKMSSALLYDMCLCIRCVRIVDHGRDNYPEYGK